MLSNKEKTFYDAELYCRRMGLYLLDIKSESEFNRIKEILKDHNKNINDVWIGYSDDGKEGKFVSVADGKTLDLSKWAKNNPHNSVKKNCIAMSTSNFLFYDKPCLEKKQFICRQCLHGYIGKNCNRA